MNSVTSIFERRSRVHNAVRAGRIDRATVEVLLSGERATNEEAVLWDYKISFPIVPLAKNNIAIADFDLKMSEIIKDVVSFHNSYGGYLIAGVDDRTREVKGFSGEFDAAELNQRVQGATGASIETVYAPVELDGAKVGVLFIPKRGEKNPVQFKKNAPENPKGKKAFSAHDFYLRERDNCRPAKSPEDFEFLYSARELDDFVGKDFFLDNNLPSRDQDLVRLIGRESEMSHLWMWLTDAFSPVKILSGLGGVGKTSIAYTFGERLVYHGPKDLDRLLWLGAKSETFSGELNKYVAVPRTDFGKIDELLLQILIETGCPPEQIPPDATQDDFLHLCQEQLSAFSLFLIIDNVDTLPDEEQQLVFHVFTQLCSLSRTKCIITARRNLGAPRSVFLEIAGLEFVDFQSFIDEKCELLKIKSPTPNSPEMARFYEESGGSPLFALSILRLIALGDNLQSALKNWRGSDGEAVREAAFQREISRLNGKEARVLLALCCLGSASVVELAGVLDLTRFEIQEALGTLQAFSMTSADTSLPGGSNFLVPHTVKLVKTLVSQRVANAKEILDKCATLKAVTSNKSPFVSQAVGRAMALLKTDAKQARLIANEALKTLPEDPDLLCLLGRCEFAAKDIPAAKAAFQRAYDLGCRRRELFAGWTEIAEGQGDWKLLIDLATLGENAANVCRYRVKRNIARANLSDERSRTGDYAGSVAILEEALGDMRDGFAKYPQPADRRLLWDQIHELVLRWLGAVGLQATAMGDGNRRLFGAYVKAIIVYHYHKPQFVQSALENLGSWLDKVSKRKEISDTAREQLQSMQMRLSQLVRAVENKPSYEQIRDRSLATAARLDAALQVLIERR